jgi:serum/glucocorticoid-regulated kinase 2
MSCPIFKFNDYKKKQERGLLITNKAVYNLKGSDVKRRIDVALIKAISFSKIGTEFVLHVPSEYDYRYSSAELRDRIVYYVLKAHFKATNEKLPIYYRDELNLVFYAMTK